MVCYIGERTFQKVGEKMTGEEFESAVKRNSRRLYLIALSFTKNICDSEDIMHNVFLKLWNFKKTFENSEHIDKWLTAVCVNESKNYIKAMFRNHADIDDCALVSSDNFETQAQQDLFNAVMHLPKKYSAVIHLFYYEDLSVKEISKILKINESAVKTRLSRAREKLKEELGDDWINEQD